MKQLRPLLPLGLIACSALASACSQEPECAIDFDCGIGSQCTLNGTCTYVGAVGSTGGNANGGGWATTLPAVGIEGATFAGNIGPTDHDGPVLVDLEQGTTSSTMRVSLPGLDSTFFFVVITDLQVLATPGTVVIGTPDDTGWSDDYAQACNYDAAEYDELLPPVTVVVSEPDDDGLTNLEIDFDANSGTRGQARIPWVQPEPMVVTEG